MENSQEPDGNGRPRGNYACQDRIRTPILSVGTQIFFSTAPVNSVKASLWRR